MAGLRGDVERYQQLLDFQAGSKAALRAAEREVAGTVAALHATGAKLNRRLGELRAVVGGPGIDSGLPCPFICMAVLTLARFLDHAGLEVARARG